jgi:hypothetical protein
MASWLPEDMKHRPTDPLIENLQDLKRKAAEKPPEPEVTDREIYTAEGSVAQQKTIGERLCPDGYQYAGTAAVHLYKKKDSVDAAILTQITDVSFIPEAFMRKSCLELQLAIMHRYGRKPPALVGGAGGPEFQDRSKESEGV